jgi:hypothetical protein
VAAAYAVEAISLIDHYRFRVVQQAASDDAPLQLKGRSGDWTVDYYNPASPKQYERLLFAYGEGGAGSERSGAFPESACSSIGESVACGSSFSIAAPIT